MLFLLVIVVRVKFEIIVIKGIYNRYCRNTKRFIIFPLLYTSSVLTSNFFFCNTGRIAHLSLQFHRNSMNGNGDIGEKY